MADRPFDNAPSAKTASLLEAGKVSAPAPRSAPVQRAKRSGWLSRIWPPAAGQTIDTGSADGSDQPLDVTYWVSTSDDKRGTPRQRTRLRTGKIVGPNNQFLSECVIVNRSPRGMRLRPVRPVALPPAFHLYDDLDKTLVEVRQVWSDNGDIGVVLQETWDSEPAAQHSSAALGQKYYALDD